MRWISADRSRWLLTAPRESGHTPTSDRANPGDHAVAVYGRADLERRLAEAERAGVDVTYARLDDDVDGP